MMEDEFLWPLGQLADEECEICQEIFDNIISCGCDICPLLNQVGMPIGDDDRVAIKEIVPGEWVAAYWHEDCLEHIYILNEMGHGTICMSLINWIHTPVARDLNDDREPFQYAQRFSDPNDAMQTVIQEVLRISDGY